MQPRTSLPFMQIENLEFNQNFLRYFGEAKITVTTVVKTKQSSLLSINNTINKTSFSNKYNFILDLISRLNNLMEKGGQKGISIIRVG